MVSFDDLEVLTGITAKRLQAGAAELAGRGVIRPARAGRLPMKDASIVAGSISFAAMNRMASTITQMSAMTACDYILHQARLVKAVRAAQKSLPAPAVQRGKPE
jgi:hypothetical protein